MEILTGEQMRRVDERAIEGLGIPGHELMEAAGRGVAESLVRDHPDLATSGVLVLCGKGNNGGDGLVAARYLAQRGIDVQVVLLAPAGSLSGDAARNHRAAREAGLEVREVPDAAAWERTRSLLGPPRIVLDAMLGTGVRGGARGLVATVIDELNRSDCRVAAVDLPSGIDADRPAVEGSAVVAQRTYTLCRPKLALVLDPAARHAGTWTVIPIGIPDEAVRAVQAELEWIDAPAAAALLPARAADSHKGTFGHLLAVAGSRGKSGAAVLLARGAMRCGVGLVTVATASSAQERVAVQQAEVMTEPLPETDAGGLDDGAVDGALALLSDRDALAVGPGLGTEKATVGAVCALVSRSECPIVIDADGLNALAVAGLSKTLPREAGGQVVLTPHPGEAARLLGCTTADVQSARLDTARRLAGSSGAAVVLKGHRSIVAAPDGRVAVNSSGNPGMASGGTGDVLTGAVGAFLARGLTAWDAARLGVFVHGDAGDRAARDNGVEGMIASDLVDRLPRSLAALERAD